MNESTHEFKIVRLRKKPTETGTLLSSKGQTYLARSQHAWQRWQLFRKGTYYLLRDGDVSPLILVNDANGVTTEPYSSHVFDSAIKSRIADRVLRTGLDWKMLVIFLLGLIAFVAAVR